MKPGSSPPLHRRLGFKIWLLLVLAFVGFEIITIPIGEETLRWIYPEWWDPDYLRGEADRLEQEAPESILRGESSPTTKLLLYGVVLAGYALFFAIVLAFITSRLVHRRLKRLAEIASRPLDEGELPGPFVDRGGDEITLLARTLDSMRGQIEELVRRLDQRDLERREWIAQVSHDLRTPLTALVLCLDRLEQTVEDAPGSDDEFREILTSARSDAGRVSALAEDLLELARLELDHALHLEPVPPGEIIQNASRTLAPLADRHEVSVEADSEPGLPILEADGRRLLRAVENLLLNSIQHAEARVHVHARGSNGSVHFVVEDDGPGLPSENGVVHFDGLRSRPDSTGLGLRITREVARAHAGVLTVENLPAGGARFVLAIPGKAPDGKDFDTSDR